MNIGPIYQTNADKLSYYLVAQQFIGIATILQNICLIFRDSFLHAQDFMIPHFKPSALTSAKKAQAAIEPTQKRLANDQMDDGDLKIEAFKVSDAIEPHLMRRITYIGIGLLRMTPLLGTLYSSSFKASNAMSIKLLDLSSLWQ